MGILNSPTSGNTDFSVVKQVFSIFTTASINKVNISLVIYIYLQYKIVVWYLCVLIVEWQCKMIRRKKEINIDKIVFNFNSSR